MWSEFEKSYMYEKDFVRYDCVLEMRFARISMQLKF
jgi:hypothetical protein